MTIPDDRLARVRRTIFERHASPWSAWSRWATTPLIYVPLWNRSWLQGALVGMWFAVNPVIFPKPRDERAWSTRAILGEERWITVRPKDTALVVNAVASAAGTVAFVAARKRRFWPTAAGVTAQMALTMVYWELMARYYDEQRH